MKKTILFALALIVSVALMAEGLSGLKVYINPGHGGWNEVNDRHIGTISYPTRINGVCDTLGFWESSSNLKVAFDLEEMLLNAGCEVMMSRRTNQSGYRDRGELDWDGKYIGYVKSGYTGTAKEDITDTSIGDRPFSTIKEECNAMGADILLSIHSNAAGSVGAACNYVALFLPGTEGDWIYQRSALTEESVVYAKAISHRMYTNPLDVFSEGDAQPNNTRWWTFTSEYSLLANASKSPTVLCEASFHSYLPNTHRYLNRDYQYLEALRFYYGFCDIWNHPLPETAVLAGDVRDGATRMSNKGYLNYIARSKDQWTPINGAKVELIQNGAVVDTYITDNNYNGMFCFRDVKPGDYTVAIAAEQYISDTFDVKLVAGETFVQNTLLTDSLHVIPLDPNFPAYAEEATLPSTILFNNIKLVNCSFLDGLHIRRLIFRNEKAYVLTEESEIYVVEIYSGHKVCQIATPAGVTLGDISFTSDNYLVASAKETISIANGKKFKLYYWESEDAMPEVLYSVPSVASLADNGVNTLGNLVEAEVGGTMAIADNIWHNKVFVSVVDPSLDPKEVRVLGIEWANTKYVSGFLRSVVLENSATYNESAWGTDYTIRLTPVDDDYIMVDGAAMLPVEYHFDWTSGDHVTMNKISAMTAKQVQKDAYGASYFNYASTPLMVLPVCNKGGKGYGFEIYNLADGPKDAVKLTDKIPADGLGGEAATFVASGAFVNADDQITICLYAQGEGMIICSQAEIPAAVADASNVEAFVYGANGILNINNAAGKSVMVFNAAGQLLYSATSASASETLQFTPGQVLFVKVGSQAVKVAL